MLGSKRFRSSFATGLVLVVLVLLMGVSQTETEAKVSYTSTELVPLTDIQQIALGKLHSCALTTSGGVKCWGTNTDGEVGDGSTTSRGTPTEVVGLSSNVVALSAGNSHTCVLTGSGSVKCWGENSDGQLGIGTQTRSLIPVEVSGLTGVKAISAGGTFTCVLINSGAVKCWGANAFGQLGDGTQTDRSIPVDVVGFTSGIQAISSATAHACALTVQGGVKCWGRNEDGELGDGTLINRSTPGDVSGLLSGVSAISTSTSSSLSCIITTSGGVKCWGVNFFGELGNGTTTRSNTPVDVKGLDGTVKVISVGGNHSCAITNSGEVKCWGSNYKGQLGDGTLIPRNTPVDVRNFAAKASTLSNGGIHTCALTVSSSIKCWGDNTYGELGDGTFIDRHTPVDVMVEKTVLGFTIIGKVTDATGVGKPNVTITNGEKTVVTDENGNYSFTQVAAGTYTILPQVSNGFINAPVNRVVLVDKDVKDVNFRQYPSPKQFLSIPIDRHMPLSQLILSSKDGGVQTSRFDHYYPGRSHDVDSSVWFWDGTVTSEGNTSKSCVLGVTCYSGHTGIDLDDSGDYVAALSAADGIIHAVISSSSGYGKHVVIDHQNGYATLYAHLENFSAGVKLGERIKRGDSVGIIGNTGNSISESTNPRSGTHLHFGVYFDQNGDGEWSINDEREVVDPFGWCTLYKSCPDDPWELQSGMVSYYLWNEVLENYATVSVGGTVIQAASGAVVLNVPANAVNQDVTFDVHVSPFTNYFEHLADFYQSINPYFTVQIREWLQPGLAAAAGGDQRLNQPMVVKLNYRLPKHFDPSSVTVARFDLSTLNWQNVLTTVDDYASVQFQTDQMGQYALIARLLCPVEPTEPNDLDVTAEKLTVGEVSGAHVFDHDADVDWFAVELQAGVEYFVTINGLAATATIYNSDGKTTVQEAAQKFTALESGEYFIRVSRQAETPVGCDAEFNILIDDKPSEPALNSTIYLPLIQQ